MLPRTLRRLVHSNSHFHTLYLATPQTSITIDDVIYVIDAGKVKETQYDTETSLSMLVETWVTRAAARQRRGRAGRTQPGTCYKLYTRKQEDNMTKFPVPEILRVPLENISLSVKAAREHQDVKVSILHRAHDCCGISFWLTCQVFLRQTIDPPSFAALDSAWNTLEDLNAVDDAGNLTALGKYMVCRYVASVCLVSDLGYLGDASCGRETRKGLAPNKSRRMHLHPMKF